MATPRGDSLDDWLETYGGSMVGGHCDGLLYPDDVAFNTQAELDAWREEIKLKVARKKPPGFAAWREEAGE